MSIQSTDLVDQSLTTESPGDYRKNVTLILLARLCERAGFYGFRGCIVFFLSQGVLHWEMHEALDIFAVLGTGIVITSLLGALLGDFVTGHRNAVMIAAGCLMTGLTFLCLPQTSVYTTYIALGLIILGSGISSPNIYAILSKSLAHVPFRMDSGFMLLAVVTNIGSFLGAYFIVLLSLENLTYAFITSAVVNLLAFICIYSLDKSPLANLTGLPPKPTNQNRLLYTILIAAAIFWFFFDQTAHAIYLKSAPLEGSYLVEKILGDLSWIFNIRANGLSPIFELIFGIILTMIWAFTYRSNSTLKLMRGYLMAAIGLILLVVIPSDISAFYFIAFTAIIAILAFAKLHIAPVILSLIGQKAPDKYIATFFGGFILLNTLVSEGMIFLVPAFFDTRMDGTLALISAIIVTTLIGFVIFILNRNLRKTA